jgi:hypothetical protein
MDGQIHFRRVATSGGSSTQPRIVKVLHAASRLHSPLDTHSSHAEILRYISYFAAIAGIKFYYLSKVGSEAYIQIYLAGEI